MKQSKFHLKANMIKEHQKLYNALNIGIYILFIPLVIIGMLLDYAGKLADLIGNFMSECRRKIIMFIFKQIYKNRGGIENDNIRKKE
jgi:D-alanyl-lipoteichoic acid acyltransferase DltB (MBOAT superfamily)